MFLQESKIVVCCYSKAAVFGNSLWQLSSFASKECFNIVSHTRQKGAIIPAHAHISAPSNLCVNYYLALS